MFRSVCCFVFKVACLFSAVGVAYVGGNDCNSSLVSPCYNTLVHYEGIGFPYYGEDDAELDDTCKVINDSFECVNSYVGACHGQTHCDEECQKIITDIGMFSLNTGLKELQSDLCNPLSAMRETYLENYVCLEDNAEQYAVCHNDSQLSQEHMNSINDTEENLRARCCFYSWYQDCFTNITRQRCNVNTTVFVSLTLHKLIGYIAQHQCAENPIMCSRPPLPAEDLDQDKHDQTDNEIDNSLNDYSSRASSFTLDSRPLIAALMFYIMWTKFQFSIK